MDPGYGAEIAAALSPDPFTLAVQEGLATTVQAAGEFYRAMLTLDPFDIYAAWNVALSNPALGALFGAYGTSLAMYAGDSGQVAQRPDATPAQVVAELDAHPTFGLPGQTPANIVSAYRAAFVKYLQVWWPQIALQRQRRAEAEAIRDIWADGTTTLNGMRWPTALVLEGPTELPDGMVYVIADGPPWNPTDGEFYLTQGPDYNPAEGAWFVAQFAGDKVDYKPVPTWYTGNFDISPLLRAALMNLPTHLWPKTETTPVHVPNGTITPPPTSPPPLVNVLPPGGGTDPVLPDDTTPPPTGAMTAGMKGAILLAAVLGLVAVSNQETRTR